MGAVPRLLHSVPMLLRGSLAAARCTPAAATSQLCCLRQLHGLRDSATAPRDAVACSRHSLMTSGRHSTPSVAHQHRLHRQQNSRRWHRLQSSASAAANSLIGDAAALEHTANTPRCTSSLPHGGSSEVLVKVLVLRACQSAGGCTTADIDLSYNHLSSRYCTQANTAGRVRGAVPRALQLWAYHAAGDVGGRGHQRPVRCTHCTSTCGA